MKHETWQWNTTFAFHVSLAFHSETCCETCKHGNEIKYIITTWIDNSSAQLKAVQLISTHPNSAQPSSTQLSSALLISAQFILAQPSSAQFSSTQLKSAQLNSALLGSAQLKSAQLMLSQVSSAHYRSAQLSSAQLRSAQLGFSQLSSDQLDVKRNCSKGETQRNIDETCRASAACIWLPASFVFWCFGLFLFSAMSETWCETWNMRNTNHAKHETRNMRNMRFTLTN